MTNLKICDRAYEQRILKYLNSKPGNITVKELFDEVSQLIYFTNEKINNEHYCDFKSKKDIGSLLDLFLQESGYDNVLFVCLLYCRYDNNMSIEEIFKLPIDGNFCLDNEKYKFDLNNESVEETIFDRFKDLRNSLIKDSLYFNHFENEQDNIGQRVNIDIDFTVKKDIKDVITKNLVQYWNQIIDMSFSEIEYNFQAMICDINTETFKKLYPAILILWMNSIKSDIKKQKVKSYEDTTLYSQDFFRCPFFRAGKKSIPRQWKQQDLYLLSLLVKYNNKGVTEYKKDAHSWKGRIYNKLNKEIAEFYVDLQEKQEFKIWEEDYEYFYPKLSSDLSNKKKSLSKILGQFGSFTFWDLIMETYLWDGSKKGNELFYNLINVNNIRLLVDIFKDPTMVFEYSTGNFIFDKSLVLLYINKLTAWADLILVSKGMPIEASVIDGFAVKYFIYRTLNNNEKRFDVLNAKFRNCNEIFSHSEELESVFSHIRNIGIELYKVVTKNSKYKLKDNDLDIEKLYENMFDEIFTDDNLNQIDSRYIIHLAYFYNCWNKY